MANRQSAQLPCINEYRRLLLPFLTPLYAVLAGQVLRTMVCPESRGRPTSLCWARRSCCAWLVAQHPLGFSSESSCVKTRAPGRCWL